MTSVIAWAVLWSLAVIGADRVICWAGDWLVEHLAARRWARIERDMGRTIERIRNQRQKET